MDPALTGEPLRVLGERLGQDFDRHLTSQLGVLGPINLPHTTFTQLGGVLEVGQRLDDHAVAVLVAR